MTNHKRMNTADLANAPRIAEELGVVTQTVRAWIAGDENFPEPVYDNGAEQNPHKLYDLVEVISWHNRRAESQERARADREQQARDARVAKLQEQIAALQAQITDGA